jgi:7-cyano-7-deazaguanine synthase
MKGTTSGKQSVLICCGGGIDSTALIPYYLKKDFQVSGVHFDYGQVPNIAEHHSVDAISKHYKIRILHRRIQPAIKKVVFPTNALVGRNAVFVLAASSMVNHKGLISLGIHSGTDYYDCSPEFVQHIQLLLDGYFGGTVLFDAPFLHFSKKDIISYCQESKVPLKLTYSCERSSISPCGLCRSCQDRIIYGV